MGDDSGCDGCGWLDDARAERDSLRRGAAMTHATLDAATRAITAAEQRGAERERMRIVTRLSGINVALANAIREDRDDLGPRLIPRQEPKT